jgi:hypothetical protein
LENKYFKNIWTTSISEGCFHNACMLSEWDYLSSSRLRRTKKPDIELWPPRCWLHVPAISIFPCTLFCRPSTNSPPDNFCHMCFPKQLVFRWRLFERCSRLYLRNCRSYMHRRKPVVISNMDHNTASLEQHLVFLSVCLSFLCRINRWMVVVSISRACLGDCVQRAGGWHKKDREEEGKWAWRMADSRFATWLLNKLLRATKYNQGV